MSVGYDDALFVLGGDPDQIAGSAASWSAFASAAAGAADGLRGLDTEDFVGDEADSYRHALNKDLSHRLRTSSDAWGMVGTSLRRFGVTLDDCQQQLRPLRLRAADAWSSLCNVRDAVHDAQAEASMYQQPQGAASAADRGDCLTDARVDGATADLNALLDRARSIRAVHDQARDACTADIRRAAGMRFADPPGWFASLVEDVTDWIADHVSVLKSISSMLKQISSIAGMLAMIPALAPIMAPIAVVAGGAAVAVDGAVMAATGQGSLTDLILDGASMVPGARAAVAVGVAQTAVTADRAAHGNGSWTDVLVSAASVVVGAKGGLHGEPEGPRTHAEGRAAEAAPTGQAADLPVAEPVAASTEAPTYESDVTSGSVASPEATAGDPVMNQPAKPDSTSVSVDCVEETSEGPDVAPKEQPYYRDRAPSTNSTTAKGDTPRPPAESAATSKGGPYEPELAATADEPTDLPENLPPGTERIYLEAAPKVPPDWAPPIPTNKSDRGKPGLRWFGPDPFAEGIRIDVGDPKSPYPTQRVDHVIVRCNHDALLPDGSPAIGGIKVNWQCHIPLSDWLQWREWNKP